MGLFVGAWVARYLGPTSFGLWNYATAFTALFGTFATLGLDSIVVRELVKEPERQNQLLGSAFALKLLGGLLTLVLAVLSISFVRAGDTLSLQLVAISAAGFIFQSLNVIDFYNQSKIQSKYTVYAMNSAFILATLFKIGLMLTGASLLAFAWVGLAEIFLSSVFLLFAFYNNHQTIREWEFVPEIARKLLADSWPLILAGIAIMVYMRIDQIMIGHMLGDKEVGLFSGAVRISEVWYFIPLAISSSVFPAIVRMKRENEALYLQRMQSFLNLMVILGLSVALPLTFLSSWLIVLLFGKAFLFAGKVLAIHIWGGIFVFLGVASGQWYLAEGLQRLAFYRTALGAVFNIAINLVFIPRYGVVGAAVSTVLSQITVGYLFDLLNPKTRVMFRMKSRAFAFFLDFPPKRTEP